MEYFIVTEKLQFLMTLEEANERKCINCKYLTYKICGRVAYKMFKINRINETYTKGLRRWIFDKIVEIVCALSPLINHF